MDADSAEDVFDRVRICIDSAGLLGLLIDQGTMDEIQQISRCCLKIRASLWILNQTWHKLSRFGTHDCRNALVLRGKLVVELQRTLYKLNLLVANVRDVPSVGSVRDLCDTFKRQIAQTSKDVMNLVNNRLVLMIHTFSDACLYPHDINQNLLKRIASTLDN